MQGLTIKEAAKELGVSTRTIFRYIQNGKLKAEKVDMPYGDEKYIWIVNPVSLARIQLEKEMKQTKSKEGK
jgi:excisionase family DNA binding protein